MRIAVDTNVLVRYLTWDDERQAKQATRTIEDADAVVISIVVFCELVWVLARAYRYANDEIIAAIIHLIEGKTAEVDRPAVEAGLAMLASGGDFADGVILRNSIRNRCETLVTFDRALAGQNDATDVTLLGA